MTREPKMTTEEWLTAWEKALGKSESEGVSAREIANRLGIGRSTANLKIREAADRGELEFVGMKSAVRIDKRPCVVPVYRAVKKKGRKR